MTVRLKDPPQLVIDGDDVKEFLIDDLWQMLHHLRAVDQVKLDELSARAGIHPGGLGHRLVRTPRTIRIRDAEKLFAALGWKLSLTITREDGDGK